MPTRALPRACHGELGLLSRATTPPTTTATTAGLDSWAAAAKSSWLGKGFILTPGLFLPCTAGTHKCTPGVLEMLSFLPPMSPDTKGTVSVPARSWWGPFRTLELLLWGFALLEAVLKQRGEEPLQS